MPAGTYMLSIDESKIIEEYRVILAHGFGQLEINVGEVAKEFKTRTHLSVSKSYVFFREKELPDFKKRTII